MTPPSICWLLLSAAVSATVVGQQAEQFENATAGISVTRPAGWQTASLQEVQANRERVRLADPELQRALVTRSTAPLFVFTKYAEPYPNLNPSIQVTLRPSGNLAGSSPTALLKLAVSQMSKALANFEYLTPIQSTKVSGLPAAHVRTRYTLTNASGERFKVLGRIWLVSRGAFMFLIGMSGPADGPDVSEREFEETLQSISIQK